MKTKRTYKGHTIEIKDSGYDEKPSFYFAVKGTEGVYATFTESEKAIAYIDRRDAALEKAKKTKLALKVIGSDGEEYTWIGFNIHTREPLLRNAAGKPSKLDRFTLYPAHPDIQGEIRALNAAQNDIDARRKKLSEFLLHTRLGYDGDYDAALAKLEAEWKDKLGKVRF